MSFAAPNPALEHQINLTRVSLRRANFVAATHMSDLNVAVYNQRQPLLFFPENFARMQIIPNMNNDAQRQFKDLFWMMQAAAGGQQCYNMYQVYARISRNGGFTTLGVIKSKEELAQVLSDVASMSCDLQILNPIAIDDDDAYSHKLVKRLFVGAMLLNQLRRNLIPPSVAFGASILKCLVL